jgi:ribosomal protein L11 methyltransferase
MPEHIQITFQHINAEQQDMLIAQLAAAGFDGFEESDQTLRAFIVSDHFDQPVLQEIAAQHQLEFTVHTIEEQNWNSSWESNFEPVIVDDFTAIRAGFHEQIDGVEHEIVITPKMSFGTGHHATTYMMVQAMREISFKNKTVFDFGTGTGILAILAEKLGATSITAIDNDDWSISNAAENLERNHCKRVQLGKAEAVPANQVYDIILANINKNVILDHFASLNDQLAHGGILVLSGLLEADEPDIHAKAGQFPLSSIGKKSRNNWICLIFKH